MKFRQPFSKVGANPASQAIDAAQIASGSDDATVKLLGEATSMANNANVTVPTVASVGVMMFVLPLSTH